jgi:allantoin racemase
MKILTLHPFGTGNYDSTVQAILDDVKRPGTTVVVDHLEKGLDFIRYGYFKAMITPDIVERVIQAEIDGYDGVYVGCSFDPGVKEAREVVEIPVVGAAVPSVFLARQLGQKFGFITDTELAKVNTYDLFKTNKLDVECVALEEVGIGTEEAASTPDIIYEKIVRVAGCMVDLGAEVIINGCTIVSAYFSAQKRVLPDKLKQIQFLDANVCAFKTLEMMVDLNQTCNVGVSRKAYYAKPQDAEKVAFEKIRGLYGLPKISV